MNNHSILIVDDEIEISTMIHTIFGRAGYATLSTASSAKEALQLVSIQMPDIIILDVMMPEIDGFQLLKMIRLKSNVPVLMLTARDEAEDRFSGFELGADDYLIKPFLSKELLLRVSAILKRTYPEANRLIYLESATVDLDKAEIRRDDKVIPLTAKEYTIFSKLAENRNRIVTIGSLCQAVCGDIWQGYESTLMTHIRHLREKIEQTPSQPQSLVTLKGLGYKLMTKKGC